jgi:hypothetical protein
MRAPEWSGHARTRSRLDRDGHRGPRPRGLVVPRARLVEVGRGQEGRRAGNARPGGDERRLDEGGLGPAADDDDVVGRGGAAQLLHDRLEDRVRRDGPRQTLEDAGETLSLGPTPGLAGPDRPAVEDGRQTDDDEEDEERHVEGPDPVGSQLEDQDQAQDEEGAGEEPPCLSDPTVLRICGQVGEA